MKEHGDSSGHSRSRNPKRSRGLRYPRKTTVTLARPKTIHRVVHKYADRRARIGLRAAADRGIAILTWRYNRPRSRRLGWRPRPMIKWSCTVTPSGFAALIMSRVTAMSAFEGVGSPEGWLCTMSMLARPGSGQFEGSSQVGLYISRLLRSRKLLEKPCSSFSLLTLWRPSRSVPS